MVDLLGMFRRRPAKRGRAGFARKREDITALGGSIGHMLTNPVRDAPPIARTAPMSGADLPFSPPAAELPRDYQREPQLELPAEQVPQRARARPGKPAKPARNGSAGPQLLRRPGFLAVHSVEKSFGSRQVVRGVSIYVRRGEAVGLLGPNGAGKTTVFYMITGQAGETGQEWVSRAAIAAAARLSGCA